MKKIKRLNLKKETISTLSDFSMSRIRGGTMPIDNTAYPTIHTCTCILPTASCQSCTCHSICDDGIFPGQCAYTQDYEICRTR